MGQRLGIVAGAGEFPLQAVADVQRSGVFCAVAGIRGAASEALKGRADAFEWVGLAEIDKLVSFFKSQMIRDVVLVGKVEPRAFVEGGAPEEALSSLLARLQDRRPTTLLRSLIAFFKAEGIEILDPGFLLRPLLSPAGTLGRVEPSADVEADIAFGWPLAKRLADLDIGQTLVVKKRAVVAVEGLEGTDATIRRSRPLAGPGIVVLKVGRTLQDMRLDVPAVGLETVRALVEAEAAALCFEAAATPFFQKDESLVLADRNGLSIIAR